MNARLVASALLLALAPAGAGCNTRGDNDEPAAQSVDAGSESGREADDEGKAPGSDDAGAARSGGGRADEHEGSLAQGDNTLQSGEFVDFYPVEVEAGQTVVAELTSESFDPYLILRREGGQQQDQVENDDYPQGDRRRSRIEHEVEQGGAWQVLVTSYEAREEGAYTLTIRVEEGGGSGRARSDDAGGSSTESSTANSGDDGTSGGKPGASGDGDGGSGGGGKE